MTRFSWNKPGGAFGSSPGWKLKQSLDVFMGSWSLPRDSERPVSTDIILSDWLRLKSWAVFQHFFLLFFFLVTFFSFFFLRLEKRNGFQIFNDVWAHAKPEREHNKVK